MVGSTQLRVSFSVGLSGRFRYASMKSVPVFGAVELDLDVHDEAYHSCADPSRRLKGSPGAG